MTTSLADKKHATLKTRSNIRTDQLIKSVKERSVDSYGKTPKKYI